MYKANPDTHQDCRSLLQKAVRRGNHTLVAKVVDHLYEIDDIKWLKRRVGVIIVEECWPPHWRMGTTQKTRGAARSNTRCA